MKYINARVSPAGLTGLFLGLLAAMACHADGTSIGKIYLPYVNALEKELEYRALYEDEDVDLETAVTRHRFGAGGAVASGWFGELAVVYADEPDFEAESYELEIRHQLTEQGEFDSDWGLMFELEKEDGIDAWEFGVGVLNTREWRRWQLTANLFLIREWGDDVKDEFETAFAYQGKYRLQRSLEPGFELFLGEDTRALGPIVGGEWRLGTTDRLQWQCSLLIGLDSPTPDETLKFELDYEFY